MDAIEPPESFLSDLNALGVALSSEQLAQMGRLVTLLLEANRRTNLTAIRDADTAWTRHVLDSLSLAAHLPETSARRLVDVGAGGGLPGLVLAIARPDHAFTLVDATGKKVRHIAETARALGLDNVRALQARAEDLTGLHGNHHQQHRARYDVALCRALAPLPVLAELVGPFLRTGGLLLAIKGQRAPEELTEAKRALELIGLGLETSVQTTTGTVLCLRKTGATPDMYPRRSGEPKRAPIR